MATITLRVEDQVKDDLEALARSRDITVTDLLRPLVEEAVGRPASESRSVHPAHLTAIERRTMSLLHQVLDKLDLEDENYHRLRAQALDEGYTAEYGDEFLGMEPELPVRDCELVRDILDMFRVIRASVNRLGPSAVAGLEHTGLLEFAGFDANDPLEGRLLNYARHLLETDRWTDLANYFDDAHDGGNSHHQALPSYRRMLEAYEPLFKAKAKAAGAWGRTTSCSVPTSWQRSPGPRSTHQSTGPSMPPIASRYASSSGQASHPARSTRRWGPSASTG